MSFSPFGLCVSLLLYSHKMAFGICLDVSAFSDVGLHLIYVQHLRHTTHAFNISEKVTMVITTSNGYNFIIFFSTLCAAELISDYQT